jgi:ribosomal protein S18 acetylase RimI-like enzyme
LADIVCLHAKKDVEAFCRRSPFVNLYSIGDLDDFFWPHTTWVALRQGSEVRQLALLYTDLAMRMPTVLAFAEQPESLMRDLLHAWLPVLPRRFHAHLTAGVADVLADDYRMQSHGTFHKMGLTDRSRAAAFDGSEAVALSAADTEDLLALYAASYPGNWFVPRMLETGFYFGIRRGRSLVSVAGVHVFSPQYKVAALGNITTRPDARGQGLATTATARLCQELIQNGIEYVGLNVKADNHSAIACYEKLGFERVTDYGEYTVANKA